MLECQYSSAGARALLGPSRAAHLKVKWGWTRSKSRYQSICPSLGRAVRASSVLGSMEDG